MYKSHKFEGTKLIYKRLISLLLAMICLLSVSASIFFAAEAPEEEEVEPTVPATVAPTKPPKPSPSALGYAAYAKKLDETVTDEELGAAYTAKSTTFKLWSPVATAVKVCIYKTGSDDEQGAQMLSSNAMKLNEATGVWSLTLKGDYQNLYYTYLVTAEGKTNEVVDPYARAVGVNGNRGMIISLADTDPKGWSSDSFARVHFAADAVVWEVSVRDFSAAASSGVSEEHRGKYLAFTEEDTTLNGEEGGLATCVAYLKSLGVNYVQINPFYDFASVDESKPLDDQYNWGYDPKNYNVPEGSYASDPYDGRVRIRECKQMIQALHNAGIGVIMDVVYNHTYYSEDSFFNQIVPSYYYRINENGTWSNGSGCGNDVASERYMVSRYIRDSVTYWAEEYHVDGFRFDLMGLIDVDTMNAVRSSLDKLPNGKYILMYGEAWNMATSVPSDVMLANQDNMYLLSNRIGAFNDTGRDAIKGSNFNASDKGFVQQGKSKGGVRSAIDGDGSGWAKVPNQCVNYASCHDNLTLYDKLTASVYGDEKYTLRRENLSAMSQLSAAIVLMSRGMPFMLAGEEMGRTKLGDENSYQSSVEVNCIDWTALRTYASMIDYYKGLISIRTMVGGALSDPTGESSQLSYLETSAKTSMAYTVSGEGFPTVVVGLNGSDTDTASVTLPDGEWIVLANDRFAGLAPLGSVKGSVELPPTSAAVLVDASQYELIEQQLAESDGQADLCTVYARYYDTRTGSIAYEERYTGRRGEDYSIDTPQDILFRYNITADSAVLSGVFDEQFAIVDISCESYDGEFSTVTIRYLDEADRQLANSVVMTNRVGQQYYTPSIPGVIGYHLDLKSLPDNGAGVYTTDPIEVIYRYLPADDTDTAADDTYTCRANVIYIGDHGDILDTKSYMGVDGDLLEVDQLHFSGYDYVAVSDSYATFSPYELNVLVYYQSNKTPFVRYVLIAGVSIVIIGALSLVLGGRGKKRKMRSIDIDD